MTLHTLKIFAMNRLNEICYDMKCLKALSFILTWGKIVYPLTTELEVKEKTNPRKNYDLAFHMQGLLFLSKNKPSNYKIKKDKFLTEFI